jgi:hypothetical protein
MLVGHLPLNRIKMGQLRLPMWAEASEAFQDDDMLQALDLINELLDDAARVGKAIFMPKYIAAILAASQHCTAQQFRLHSLPIGQCMSRFALCTAQCGGATSTTLGVSCGIHDAKPG